MQMRYLFAVLALTAIGAGLLGLRQQQHVHLHAMATMHADLRNDREAVKDLKIRIAELDNPDALRETIRRLNLQYEPINIQSEQQDAGQPGGPR